MIVERDVVDLYRAIYMQAHVGETFSGRIAGFAPFGIFVQIEDPFVSVLLPFEQLDESFEPDDVGIRLIGSRTSKVFTMNDPVTVRVEEANVQSREVVGSLLSHSSAGRSKPAEKKKGGVTKKKPRRPRRKGR